MRPVDLARQHGLSTQAVRNYEDAGIIPPAHRSRTGYRDYTATHAAGLAAYLALVPAFGYSTSRRIMHAVTGGQLDEALEYVDDGHALLARDRNTLRTVEAALSHLGAATPDAAASTRALEAELATQKGRYLRLAATSTISASEPRRRPSGVRRRKRKLSSANCCRSLTTLNAPSAATSLPRRNNSNRVCK